MRSPFPGMDPFLEEPFFWHQVHSRLIVALSNELGAKLRPKYYAAIETRTYFDDEEGSIFVGIPDAIIFNAAQVEVSTRSATTATITAPQPQRIHLVEPIEVKERYLEIRKVRTHEVIVAIEVLSPKNKRSEGRKIYLKKRQTILESATHFVEIDLLRAFSPMPVMETIPRSHYHILVSDSRDRPEADLYSFNLQEPIPIFGIPLKPEDTPIAIDLTHLLQEVYEQGCFDLQINYQSVLADLSPTDLDWVKQVVDRSSSCL
jgi:Protein of unknown function (DUF4058)